MSIPAASAANSIPSFLTALDSRRPSTSRSERSLSAMGLYFVTCGQGSGERDNCMATPQTAFRHFLVGPVGIEPTTEGLCGGGNRSDSSGGVGVIQRVRNFCRVLSVWSGGVGLVRGMKRTILVSRSCRARIRVGPMSKIECDPTSLILGDDVSEVPIGEQWNNLSKEFNSKKVHRSVGEDAGDGWRGVVLESSQAYVETRLCLPKSRFNELRCRASGENEPEVAIAFGNWHYRTPRCNTDFKADHSFGGKGALLSKHVVEYSCRTDREHHHARCLRLTGESVEPNAKSMTNNHFFEAHPRSEPEGSRAQASNGPCCQFKNRHHTIGADAQLDVDRAFAKPQCRSCLSCGGPDIGQDFERLA